MNQAKMKPSGYERGILTYSNSIHNNESVYHPLLDGPLEVQPELSTKLSL